MTRSGWDTFWLVVASLLVTTAGAALIVVLAWSGIWAAGGYAVASLLSPATPLPENPRTSIPYDIRVVDGSASLDCSTTRCWTWEITPLDDCPGTPYARVETSSRIGGTVTSTTDHALYAMEGELARELTIQRGEESEARVTGVFCWGTW